ncbi:NAD-dependent epimerase/dehydratase family protein [Microbacterium excoecariae]|uniref:NAD-dependent epimerase/dehydratase family protein n=1 Tax=Microbacterium excoecariae TaxID=2715210 RepID=UPI00140A639E
MSHFLLTGAAGMAATGIRPLLAAAGHRVTLLDPAPVAEVADSERALRGSFLDAGTLDEAMTGVDTVVHMGGLSRERPWEDILATNIDGTQRVLEAAHRAGVRRALLASSTHAIGFWPVGTPGAELVPRPDTYYGVSKVAAEALGSVFADRFGMTVVSARIGTLSDIPRSERHRHTWLSYADLVRLVEATDQTATPGHHIVYAVSGNTKGWFPLGPGRDIGYDPRDDAEAWAPFPPEPQADPDLIGGAFADDEHPLGGTW